LRTTTLRDKCHVAFLNRVEIIDFARDIDRTNDEKDTFTVMVSVAFSLFEIY